MGCCDSKPESNSPTASASISNRGHVEIEEQAEQAWCGRKRRSKSQGAARGENGSRHGGGALSEGMTCSLHMPASQLRREIMKLQYREVTPEDYELLCLLDESLPKKNTISEALVQDLPLIHVRELTSKCCQVCLLELGDCKVPQLPCGHAFHFECARKWLTGCSGRCPICQVSLLDLHVPSQLSSSSDPASALVSSDAQSPESNASTGSPDVSV